MIDQSGHRRLDHGLAKTSISIATNAFYFQEGHAQRYDRAKYGELRVDESGGSVLIGLRDSRSR